MPRGRRWIGLDWALRTRFIALMRSHAWQDEYGGSRLTPAVRALLVATVSVFVVQLFFDALTGGAFTRLASLSIPGLKRGYLWQPVTYLFLHGGLIHLLLNMLGLYFLGPETERAIGTRQFCLLYFVSGVLAGVGWLFISNVPWAVCVGASGALFGIIGAFAALFPNRLITVYVFMILPVTLRAWVLAVALVVVELSFLLNAAGGVAYAAHLAGGVAGYVYAVVLFGRGGRTGGWLRSLRQRPSGRAASDSGVPTDDLDRVLDKIAREGMGSLSRLERDLLKRASRGQRGR